MKTQECTNKSRNNWKGFSINKNYWILSVLFLLIVIKSIFAVHGNENFSRFIQENNRRAKADSNKSFVVLLNDSVVFVKNIENIRKDSVNIYIDKQLLQTVEVKDSNIVILDTSVAETFK